MFLEETTSTLQNEIKSNYWLGWAGLPKAKDNLLFTS